MESQMYRLEMTNSRCPQQKLVYYYQSDTGEEDDVLLCDDYHVKYRNIKVDHQWETISTIPFIEVLFRNMVSLKVHVLMKGLIRLT